MNLSKRGELEKQSIIVIVLRVRIDRLLDGHWAMSRAVALRLGYSLYSLLLTLTLGPPLLILRSLRVTYKTRGNFVLLSLSAPDIFMSA